jgi:hypothetical protein
MVVYAVATRGLFRATNGLRLSLVDLGAELLESPDVSAAKKEIIRSSLDDVHSARSAWGITVLLPIALITFPFWRAPADLSARLPGTLQATFETFLNRWFITTISNSVTATILCTIFVVIVSAFASSMYPLALLVMRKRGVSHTKHAHA